VATGLFEKTTIHNYGKVYPFKGFCFLVGNCSLFIVLESMCLIVVSLVILLFVSFGISSMKSTQKMTLYFPNEDCWLFGL
jgi:hypothetical protein